MRNLSRFLIIGSALIFLSSDCNNNEPEIGAVTEVTLNFSATYGDSPLLTVLTENKFEYQERDIKIDRFSFYISDIVLLKDGSEDELELSEIEFLDFTENTSLAEAETPQSLTFTNVPVGDYRGIAMSIGVPADLNAQQPLVDFAEGHPLHPNSHYWSDWQSYIFMKINGLYDKADDGNDSLDGSDTGFAIHTGSDAAYRAATPILIPITLIEGELGEVNLNVDLEAILTTGDKSVDFQNADFFHTGDINDLSTVNLVMDNFVNAISLK